MLWASNYSLNVNSLNNHIHIFIVRLSANIVFISVRKLSVLENHLKELKQPFWKSIYFSSLVRMGGARIDTLVIRISLGQCEPPISKGKENPWHKVQTMAYFSI